MKLLSLQGYVGCLALLLHFQIVLAIKNQALGALYEGVLEKDYPDVGISKHQKAQRTTDGACREVEEINHLDMYMQNTTFIIYLQNLDTCQGFYLQVYVCRD